mmetsp:Transcript_50587/g.83853  ORF Transcript_50587/g.83853 Transcript_50587/m.83853 type:complete len:176 (-) Transcript_50587:86-613(-)
MEAFAYDGKSTITLPNENTPGDCIHDKLVKDKVSISSITYDSISDAITINVTYIFIDVSVLLSKVTGGLLLAQQVQSVSEGEQLAWFNAFIVEFGKTYSTSERLFRYAAFRANLALISSRNHDGNLGNHFINKFADLNTTEFRAMRLGYRAAEQAGFFNQDIDKESDLNLDKEVA